MKRLIVLLATLLLSFGLVYGANVVEIKSSFGDTIRYGVGGSLDVWLTNDAQVGGFQFPMIITGAGGVTWTYNTQVDNAWGTNKYITNNPAGRLVPVAANFDGTGGILVVENGGMVGFGAGVGASGQGMAVGGPTWEVSEHLTVTAPDEEFHSLCVDINGSVGALGYTFSDYGGTELVVEFQGSSPSGVWCWPTGPARNFCPEITGGPTAITGPHCGVATGAYTAHDDDVPADAIEWSYEIISGAGTVTLAPANTTCGLTYDFGAGEMAGGVAQVLLKVTDAFHAGQVCDQITVMVNATDVAPTIACGVASHTIPVNQVFTKADIVGGDVDVCDDLVFSTAGPGVVDPATGVYSWTPTDSDEGTYTIVVEVTDGSLTAECSFTVNVVSFTGLQVVIEKTHGTLQGHYETVEVSFGKATNDVGGFDLLIGYDASGLNFTGAELAQDLKDCGWEYFTYRYNWNGNCGNGCPSGLLRLVGLAETNNGPISPDDVCLGDLQDKGIATLTFFVSNDRTLECQYLPIRFYWMDCTDNTMSDLTGDTLYMGRNIYNFDDNPLDPTQAINYGLTVNEDGIFWPGYYGWAVECWPGQEVDIKQYPLVYLDFIDGGIDVICADSIDARGDINLNGLANEIADAVMFTNYFIQGLSAFGATAEGSIAASDVNADGLSLSVADLVYLIRVIVGDALPYAKPAPGSSFAVTTQVLNGQMAVNYDATSEVGAVLLTFSGPVGTPILGNGAQNMDVVYSDTKVLVYNIGNNAIAAGANELLTVPVEGSVELVSIEVADFYGGAMETTTRTLPSEFAVSQNYPNPFNPTTTIALSLPTASKWNLAIYNVAGQLVKDFNGNDAAGNISIVWDGTDNNGSTVASGIYFYKMVASNFSATKKMVLMK
ncbi:MAG: T9SS type A sorting domain-containing protein [candidate division Zixibacteria bacterium]|nr:T9SS type A sorting domain-containing protein [candidate division Zixibacteria bacterium]